MRRSHTFNVHDIRWCKINIKQAYTQSTVMSVDDVHESYDPGSQRKPL